MLAARLLAAIRAWRFHTYEKKIKKQVDLYYKGACFTRFKRAV
jgi:hypothetical protein